MKCTLDKIRFMNISEGSLGKLKYCLILTKDPGYIKQHNLGSITNKIFKLLPLYYIQKEY